MGTYSNSGIELHIHAYSLFRLKHKTAHHQSKLALKFSFTANIRPRVDLFLLLKPKIFSVERLVCWHNHDNRLDNNNQT